MKVCVVGLGYIGLPTALMLASHGVEVDAVDCNPEIVGKLRNRQLSFSEKGLEELYAAATKEIIRFHTACVPGKVYIVAVPTPYIEQTKQIEPKYVMDAVRDILQVCEEDAIIVIESTVSPGTMDRYIRPLLATNKRTVHLAHAPERIIPGNMVYELENNSRIIGCDNPEIGSYIKEIYSSFCKGEFVLTDIRTAEMTKVVENTFRDINIAYANELAKICRKADLDVYEIIRIANMHPRVNILQPGPGVGGHCISVDPWFLVGDFPGETDLIRCAREINSTMPEFVLKRIREIMEENRICDFSRVGIYGLTYKENVDDIRESPTLQLLTAIQSKNIHAPAVYDPYIVNTIAQNQYFDFSAFLNACDMVVVMVAHRHIKENRLSLQNKVILDTRNVFADVYKL